MARSIGVPFDWEARIGLVDGSDTGHDIVSAEAA